MPTMDRPTDDIVRIRFEGAVQDTKGISYEREWQIADMKYFQIDYTNEAAAELNI